MFEKIVVVTRKTRLEELIERFNSRAQAKFYIDRSTGDFPAYAKEDEAYRRSIDLLRRSLEVGLKIHFVDRELVPTMMFAPTDIIVTAGQDGLVANVAKYVGSQPVVGVNPDSERYDGILLKFKPEEARSAVLDVAEGRSAFSEVTLAEAALADGQRLLAFNDLFIGPRSHASARYSLAYGGRSEVQSSSGVIVSTGAGSTGWLSSLFNMAAGVTQFAGGRAGAALRMKWEDPRLVFVVREPFASRHSTAGIVAGIVEAGTELTMESAMPSGGVIFSDGVEADRLDFNSGARLTVKAAGTRARLAAGRA